MRALAPFVRTSVDHDILVRRARDRVAVGRAGWSIAKSGKGKSAIRVRLDPAHADLAPYLVQRALHEVLSQRPNLPVHLFLPAWMPEVGGQAEAVGFLRKRTHKAMGMKL
jgi:hypothetical protein